MVAAGVGDALAVWDAESGRAVLRLADLPAPVHLAAVSPDGKRLAYRDTECVIHIHDLKTGRPTLTLGGAARYHLPLGVAKLRFSSDGRRLAVIDVIKKPNSGLLDQDVWLEAEVWNATAIEPPGRFTLAEAKGLQNLAAAVSPDLESVAVGNGIRLTLHSLTGGKPRDLPQPARRPGARHWGWRDLSFLPDGRLTGLSSAAVVSVWDDVDAKPRVSGAPVEIRKTYSVYTGGAFAIDPAGRTSALPLSTAGYGGEKIRLFAVRTGKEVAAAEGHSQALDRAAFQANGLVVTEGHDGRRLTWGDGRLTEDRRRRAENVRDRATALDGSATVTVNGAKLVTLFLPGGRPRPVVKYERRISCLAVSSAGRYVAARASRHNAPGAVSVYDGKTGRRLWSDAPARNSNTAMAFSPDGRLLAVAWVGSVELRRADTGRLVSRCAPGEYDVRSLRFSPDGYALAVMTGGPAVTVVEAASGEVRRRFVPVAPRRPWQYWDSATAAFAPGGRVLAYGDGPAAVLADLHTGRELARLVGHRGPVRCVAFSPDGRSLVTGAEDTTAVVWRPELPEPPAARGAASWAALASADAAKAYEAIVALAADPSAATLIGRHLEPARGPDAAKLAGLIAELDGASAANRRRATAELIRLGPAARPPLRAARRARNLSPEAHRRLRHILKRLDAGGPATPERLQLLRAVEALELAGGPAARGVLRKVAGGAAGDPLTEAAAAALNRRERTPR